MKQSCLKKRTRIHVSDKLLINTPQVSYRAANVWWKKGQATPQEHATPWKAGGVKWWKRRQTLLLSQTASRLLTLHFANTIINVTSCLIQYLWHVQYQHQQFRIQGRIFHWIHELQQLSRHPLRWHETEGNDRVTTSETVRVPETAESWDYSQLSSIYHSRDFSIEPLPRLQICHQPSSFLAKLSLPCCTHVCIVSNTNIHAATCMITWRLFSARTNRMFYLLKESIQHTPCLHTCTSEHTNFDFAMKLQT